jgi:hypothetical protein
MRVTKKGKTMKTLRPLALMAIAAGFLLAPTEKAHAQVAVSIGAAPGCPYGYYEAPPYNCAPDGYYGPEWFGGGGIFIGAGPWYHGSDHFYGHVDHQLDYRKGYHGAMPARGAAPAEHRAEFHGQAMHDVHGHEAPRGRK